MDLIWSVDSNVWTFQLVGTEVELIFVLLGPFLLGCVACCSVGAFRSRMVHFALLILGDDC